MSPMLCTVLALSPWAFQECTEWKFPKDGMIYMLQCNSQPGNKEHSGEREVGTIILWRHTNTHAHTNRHTHQRFLVFFVIGESIRTLLVSCHPWGTFPQTGLTLPALLTPLLLLLPTPSLPSTHSLFPTLSSTVSTSPPLFFTLIYFLFHSDAFLIFFFTYFLSPSSMLNPSLPFFNSRIVNEFIAL